MEQLRMAAFGIALGLACTTWFVLHNVTTRLILEPWKNRRHLAVHRPSLHLHGVVR